VAAASGIDVIPIAVDDGGVLVESRGEGVESVRFEDGVRRGAEGCVGEGVAGLGDGGDRGLLDPGLEGLRFVDRQYSWDRQTGCGQLGPDPTKESKDGTVFDPLQAAFEVVLPGGKAVEMMLQVRILHV